MTKKKPKALPPDCDAAKYNQPWRGPLWKKPQITVIDSPSAKNKDDREFPR